MAALSLARVLGPCVATAILASCATTAPEPPAKRRALAEILKESPKADWRAPDPENTMYLDLAAGRIAIELAPDFAPRHVANIRTLVREGYFDGLAVIRAQDNYVAQWGDGEEAKAMGSASAKLAPEFTRPASGLAFDALPDADTYAPETGFSNGFAAARDAKADRAWMIHCYGVVGVGRGNDSDSGNGSSLYAIIGSPARLLDRNITVVGRVLRGIERLSTLRRGTGPLGFYERIEDRTLIAKARMAADVPAPERMKIEILRTDSATFREVVELRRWRRDDWYKEPAGRVDVCSSPVPVRDAP